MRTLISWSCDILLCILQGKKEKACDLSFNELSGSFLVDIVHATRARTRTSLHVGEKEN